MVAQSPTRFPEVAAALAANGYRPLPIKPGEKHPGFDEWPAFAFAPGCEKKYPKHGAGIILGDVVGLDIDVDCPDAARAIEEAARQVLGLGDAAEIPRRIGQAPRVLLPLRTSTPFHKITSALFRMRSAPDAPKASKVEVLAEGQQFVAFAIHKDTHRPYTWNGGGDLLAVPRDQLPEITEAQAREIIRVAETVLEQWGDRVTTKAKGDKAQGAAPPGADIPDGTRDDTLYLMGRKMHYAGFDEPAMLCGADRVQPKPLQAAERGRRTTLGSPIRAPRARTVRTGARHRSICSARWLRRRCARTTCPTCSHSLR